MIALRTTNSNRIIPQIHYKYSTAPKSVGLNPYNCHDSLLLHWKPQGGPHLTCSVLQPRKDREKTHAHRNRDTFSMLRARQTICFSLSWPTSSFVGQITQCGLMSSLVQFKISPDNRVLITRVHATHPPRQSWLYHQHP